MLDLQRNKYEAAAAAFGEVRGEDVFGFARRRVETVFSFCCSLILPF
jgi:hypothetical protein